MKLILSILLSFSVLLQTMHFHKEDVYAIVEFFAHAKIHIEKNDDTFVGYLQKHFGEDAQKYAHKIHQEEKHHKHLPTKHDCKINLHQNVVVDFPDLLPISLMKPNYQTHQFFYKDLFSSFEQQVPIQPPGV